MKWTRNDPQEWGWYWFKDWKTGTQEIVKVMLNPKTDKPYWVGFINWRRPIQLKLLKGEWIGPLQEPKP